MHPAGGSNVTVTLENHTQFLDENLINFVKFCLPPGITQNFRVIIKQEEDFDGTAYPGIKNRWVEIILPANQKFPMILSINSELPGSYLRDVYLANLDEFLVFLLAHESSHILYDERPNIIKINKNLSNFMEQDEETFADFYGLAILNKFRRANRVEFSLE